MELHIYYIWDYGSVGQTNASKDIVQFHPNIMDVWSLYTCWTNHESGSNLQIRLAIQTLEEVGIMQHEYNKMIENIYMSIWDQAWEEEKNYGLPSGNFTVCTCLPLNMAVECRRNNWFTHSKWWFSTAM